MDKEIIIKDTHRGLKYVDGVLTEVLSAGRYRLPRKRIWERLPGRRLWERLFGRSPIVEIELVDMRQRDLTIKGQEILTADKVAIRVSILVQFAVIDPKAAIHKVANYEERLYSDVQLAARRSLATMTLEEILTNRNRLSEDIRRQSHQGPPEVKSSSICSPARKGIFCVSDSRWPLRIYSTRSR